MKKNNSQGVALLSVLLIIALVSFIAVRMSSSLRLQIARTQSYEQAEQAYWLWLSAESLTRQVLLQAFKQSEEPVNLAQDWAKRQGPFPVNGGTIEGQIKDLHACFNLNSLRPQAAQDARFKEAIGRYEALLQALDFDSYLSQQLVATLVDWLDQDSELYHPLGAENPDYAALAEPYQATNNLMTHISELRQVIGYTQEIYKKLAPYVCVIPGVQTWHLNINTLSARQPELLEAYFQGSIDRNAAENFLSNRPKEGYDSIEAVRQEASLQAYANSAPFQQTLDTLIFTSQYFELETEVRYGELSFFGYTQFYIEAEKVWTLNRSQQGYPTDE